MSNGQDEADPEQRRRDFTFPRKEKLKGRNEIREVFNRKKAIVGRGMKLFIRPNGLTYNRIAFTFSRKFGNAVERNHSRRLSREVYRLLRNELRKGYDMVLLVFPSGNPEGPHESGRSSQGDFISRKDEMRRLFFRAGLFNTASP